MAYFSKSTIIEAYSYLSNLTDDPSAQGATQATSSLRYLFALDEFFKRNLKNCDAKIKSDKDEFIKYVGHVVSINDNFYTANFFNAIKENVDYAVGSNFFSVNAVKNSLENPNGEYPFPKRGSSPLFTIQNGVLIRKQELFSNINSVLHSDKLKSAFAIWLLRNKPIEKSALFESMKEQLLNSYTEALVCSFFTDETMFVNDFTIEFSEAKSDFLLDDFPQKKFTKKQMESVLLPEEQINRVRDSFTKFVHLINTHTNDFTGYIIDFEKYINPLIHESFPQYKSVFQIVDIDLFNGVIAKLQEKTPELKNVFADEYQGTRYAAFRTTKYYRTYLQILSFSDFRSNIDEQAHNGIEFINTSKQDQLKEPLQQIYYGAPGTGKSFTIDDLTDDDNSVRITFHPDTDYASFVGAYKPTMESVKMSAFVGKEVQFAQPQQGHPGTEQRIVYKYVPQAFLKAYVAAWSNLDTPYYLIIEEINRGNCAQIFGDLFQLLDRNNVGSSSYAINADEDIAKFLKEDKKGFASLSEKQRDAIAAYELVKDNGKKQAIGEKILDGTLLLLPPKLHIWATMNTSDQSLFPIDSAFKRRWNWKYVPIDTNPLDKRTHQPFNWKFEVAGNLYSWGKFLKFINPKIYDITESSDKQMGYFFAKADPATGIISEEVFLNKVLFYLWTDVFKDYEVSDQIFNNKNNNNKPFRFTDFFEDAEALANFIENCKLDSEETEPQNAEEDAKLSTSRLNETAD